MNLVYGEDGYIYAESVSDHTFTATIGPICEHKNGWYGTIPFGIFHRRIFACSDCGEMLCGKKLKRN